MWFGVPEELCLCEALGAGCCVAAFLTALGLLLDGEGEQTNVKGETAG